eukprot:5034846-Prorocentrum_lima.AAC.1
MADSVKAARRALLTLPPGKRNSELCPFPKIHQYSEFQWELERRSRTFAGIERNRLASVWGLGKL